MSETAKPFPTRYSESESYIVERKEGDKWVQVHFERAAPGVGVPTSPADEGVNILLYMHSYEQAMALAWIVKANSVAALDYAEVRVVPFRVICDAKAYRQDGKEIPVGVEPLLKPKAREAA